MSAPQKPRSAWLRYFIMVIQGLLLLGIALYVVAKALLINGVNQLTLILILTLVAGCAYLAWRQARTTRAVTLYKKGIEALTLKRYDEALALFDRVISLRPSYTFAWFNKSAAFTRLKRFDEALAASEQGLRLNSNFAAGWYNQGLLLSRVYRLDDALDAIDVALSLNANDANYWIGRGVILGRLKKYDEALAADNRALTLDPSEPLAWNNKASVLCENLKRYDEALSACNTAISRGISIAGIWFIKGECLHHLDRETEARAAFGQTLTFPTDDFLSWVSSGHALAAWNATMKH